MSIVFCIPLCDGTILVGPLILVMMYLVSHKSFFLVDSAVTNVYHSGVHCRVSLSLLSMRFVGMYSMFSCRCCVVSFHVASFTQFVTVHSVSEDGLCWGGRQVCVV